MISKVSKAFTSKYLLKKLIANTLTIKQLIKAKIINILIEIDLFKQSFYNLASIVRFNIGMIQSTFAQLQC